MCTAVADNPLCLGGVTFSCLILHHSISASNVFPGCWVNNTLHGNNETIQIDSCTSCVCRVRGIAVICHNFKSLLLLFWCLDG